MMSCSKQENDALRKDVEAIEVAVKLYEGEPVEGHADGQVGEILWDGFSRILAVFDTENIDESTIWIAQKLYDRTKTELSAKESFMLALSSVDQNSKFGTKTKVRLSEMLTSSIQRIDRKLDRFFVNGVEAHARMFHCRGVNAPDPEMANSDNNIAVVNATCEYLKAYFSNEKRVQFESGIDEGCGLLFDLVRTYILPSDDKVIHSCSSMIISTLLSLPELEGSILPLFERHSLDKRVFSSPLESYDWLDLSDESESDDDRDIDFIAKQGEAVPKPRWSKVGLAGIALVELSTKTETAGTRGFPSILSSSKLLEAVGGVACSLLSSRQNQRTASRGLELVQYLFQNFHMESLQFSQTQLRRMVVRLFLEMVGYMVSCPDASARYHTWRNINKMFDTLEQSTRLALFEKLLIQCPYANVKGMLLDRIRLDVSHLWDGDVFSSPKLSKLIFNILGNLDLSELLSEADTISSTLLLARFILIRDRNSNSTGLCKASQKAHLSKTVAAIKLTCEKLIDENEREVSILGSEIESDNDDSIVELRPSREMVKQIIENQNSNETPTSAFPRPPILNPSTRSEISLEQKTQILQKDILNLHLLRDTCIQAMETIQSS